MEPAAAELIDLLQAIETNLKDGILNHCSSLETSTELNEIANGLTPTAKEDVL